MLKSVLVGVVVLVCSSNLCAGDDSKERQADLRGPIAHATQPTETQKKNGVVVVLRVGEMKGNDTSQIRAVITVTDKCKILKKVGDKNEPAKAEELKEGCEIEVVFNGPAAKSKPIQALAAEIVILDEKK